MTFFFSNDFNIYGMMLWVFCFNTLLIDFYMVHCLSQSVCATKLGMCFSNQLELNPKLIYCFNTIVGNLIFYFLRT